MKHRGVKFLSLLLTLVMVIGLMPGMSLTALAWEGDPYASLLNTTTVVNFDGKQWYLIENNSTAANAGTVTLLAKECVAASSFGSNNTYSGSTVETAVNTYYNGSISSGVKSAVVDNKMFLLTKNQANAMTEDTRECTRFSGTDGNYWWLCSSGGMGGYATCVDGLRSTVYDFGLPVSKTYGVRPALKLDLSKVTFDSTSNTFTVGAASYTVTLTGGTNATASGATTQNVTPGQTMTTVTYTANSGNKFPETSNLYTTTNGITVTRTSDTVVTVSGTPTANVNITVPDAAAIPTYTVTYDANGGSGEMKPTKVSKNDEGKYIYKVESCGFTAPEGETFDYWLGSDGKTYRPGPEVEISANLTLTAQWKKSGSDGGDSDGSSGSGFDLVFNIPGADNSWEYVGGGYAPQQAYRVSLAPMQGGSAALGLTTGDSGTQMNVYPSTTVFVFPNAEQGYTLDKIVWSLIDGSASYDITEAKNFVMPAMDVVVYVTFQPLAS